MSEIIKKDIKLEEKLTPEQSVESGEIQPMSVEQPPASELGVQSSSVQDELGNEEVTQDNPAVTSATPTSELEAQAQPTEFNIGQEVVHGEGVDSADKAAKLIADLDALDRRKKQGTW